MAVLPDSVLMSTAKRPGAPEVRPTRELRWTVIFGLAWIFAISAATPVSSGSAYGERVGTRR